MLQKTFFRKLRKRWVSYDQERRTIMHLSGEVLANSKQAIFAFHRDDRAAAKKLLAEADVRLSALSKHFKKTYGLSDEGSYRAALEEYAEARYFEAFLAKKPLAAVEAPAIDDDALVGGILDFTGEAVRYAVKAATHGDDAEVKRAQAVVESVAGEMMQMNLTGSARQKFDQLKSNLRKLEEIQYDLSLRGSRR